MDHMSIELKSTASLIDELCITELKMVHFGKDKLQERYEMLDAAISRRLKRHTDADKLHTLSILTLNLKHINGKCWDAQEEVMKGDLTEPLVVAMAAKQAQNLNAVRNNVIREIDDLLGESQYSQLEKSYG